MSEINVTPFVDVMLVLLIIFMVTAPLLKVGVSVDLPDTKAPALVDDSNPLIISIMEDGKIYLNDHLVPSNELVAKLKAISNQNFKVPIYIQGDKKSSYGSIVKIMGHISTAGFQKIALMANSPSSGK